MFIINGLCNIRGIRGKRGKRILRLNKWVQKCVKKRLKIEYEIPRGEEYSIPHYSIMANPDLQIKPLIFGRLSERDMEKVRLHIFTQEVKAMNAQWIREYYLKCISKEGKDDPFQNYFTVIKDALLEIDELWLYDYLCYLKWSGKRNKFIEIQFDGEEYGILSKNKSLEHFKYSEWMKSNCKVPEDYFTDESECFVKWIEKKIKYAHTVFPIKFRYSINYETNTLRLEDECKLIQLESLINTSILNLYKVHKKEKYEENIRKREIRNLGKQYNFLEVKSRFKEMIDEEKYGDQDKEIYGFLFEKMTGRLLCEEFLRYYDEIYNNFEGYDLPHGTDKLYVHKLLIDVLDEFIGMPNVIRRRYILKELMETVLYWKGDICKKLVHVANMAYYIKKKYLEEWEKIEEENIDLNEVEELLYSKKIHQDTWREDSIAIYEKKETSKNYAIINCHIMQNLQLYHVF